jgi:hypothetical protein
MALVQRGGTAKRYSTVACCPRGEPHGSDGAHAARVKDDCAPAGVAAAVSRQQKHGSARYHKIDTCASFEGWCVCVRRVPYVIASTRASPNTTSEPPVSDMTGREMEAGRRTRADVDEAQKRKLQNCGGRRGREGRRPPTSS